MNQQPTPSQKRTVRFSIDDTEKKNDSDNSEQPKIPFWSENPNVLLDKDTMLEFYPMDSMTFNQKLNAVTRMILLITILMICFVRNIPRILFLSVLSLAAIWGMHQFYASREGMESGNIYGSLDTSSVNEFSKLASDINLSSALYQQPSPNNPFSNVLVSDYDDNPQKLPAPPISNPTINQMVMDNAVQSIQNAHPNLPNISDKLFRDIHGEMDIKEQLNFEQSLRQFNSNPSTTIPNDQGAFAQFCYGDMISCKEGNIFACSRNTSHYTNY
jgi:Family of unknown function (DUF5762)